MNNYNKHDHSHCWSSKNPPYGQKIKHAVCCLCQKENPEIFQDICDRLEKVSQENTILINTNSLFELIKGNLK